jgi:glyoxylase-like metal-dependent hydrolase (beta-lactamase superfamily II)
MRRVIFLGALLTVGGLSYTVAAFQQPQGGQQAPRVVEVAKLKDNLFVLRGQGGGGNTAVFVMADGITVVDTKNPGWGQPILDKIKELSPKPVLRIINTHTHGDHVSGNVEFPTTVDIVVHENTKTNMEQMRAVAGIAKPGAPPPPNIFKENGGKGLPKQTYKDKMSIGKGADQVDLFYFGRGHTNGDAWVLFPALRVVHAGDIFSGKNLPLLDSNNGGSAAEIGNTLAKAHSALSKAADTIITGHSTEMTMNDLKEYADFNNEFLTTVRAEKKAGKTAEAIAKAWTIPTKYSGYAPLTPQTAPRVQSNVQAVFNETP